MGKLSTHVLDVTQGRPDAGVKLYALINGNRILLKSLVTNQDGCCDAPLLESDARRPV